MEGTMEMVNPEKKVLEIVGPFSEVYPAAAEVFGSLPRQKDVGMIRKAVEDCDYEPILRWEMNRKKEYFESDTPEWCEYAEVKLFGYRGLTFITPTSGRCITVYKNDDGEIEVKVYFINHAQEEGSVQAAFDVLYNIWLNNPSTSAKYMLEGDYRLVGPCNKVSGLDFTFYQQALSEWRKVEESERIQIGDAVYRPVWGHYDEPHTADKKVIAFKDRTVPFYCSPYLSVYVGAGNGGDNGRLESRAKWTPAEGWGLYLYDQETGQYSPLTRESRA